MAPDKQFQHLPKHDIYKKSDETECGNHTQGVKKGYSGITGE